MAFKIEFENCKYSDIIRHQYTLSFRYTKKQLSIQTLTSYDLDILYGHNANVETSKKSNVISNV